jgi:hypothetical protein
MGQAKPESTWLSQMDKCPVCGRESGWLGWSEIHNKNVCVGCALAGQQGVIPRKVKEGGAKEKDKGTSKHNNRGS